MRPKFWKIYRFSKKSILKDLPFQLNLYLLYEYAFDQSSTHPPIYISNQIVLWCNFLKKVPKNRHHLFSIFLIFLSYLLGIHCPRVLINLLHIGSIGSLKGWSTTKIWQFYGFDFWTFLDNFARKSSALYCSGIWWPIWKNFEKLISTPVF